MTQARSRRGALVGLVMSVAAACRPLAPTPGPSQSLAAAVIPPPPSADDRWPMAPGAKPPPAPAPPAIGTARTFAGSGVPQLTPGRYAWAPGEPRRAGTVGVVVDLGRQLAYVYRRGALIGVSTVSTGRRHHETPTGSFPILEKAVWHRSTLYSGAPMPWMERLTWGGVALHAGGVPGYRQSHGCIHLPPAFARTLFGMTAIGTEVRVVNAWHGQAPAPAREQLVWTGPLPSTEQSVMEIADAAL